MTEKTGHRITDPVPADNAGEGKGSAATPLYYRQPEPLNRDKHVGKGLRQPVNFRFAAKSHAVVLHAEEFRVAAAHYPIVFADDESALPIAVLGYLAGRNLFVDNAGAWEQGAYIPAYVRRYPFASGRGTTDEELVLYVDSASDLIVDTASTPGAEPLLINGEPTERTKKALEFCIAFQGQVPITSAFVDELKARDMLERRDVKLDMADGQQRQLSGLRIIKEDAFKALPDNVYLEWRHRGWIGLVHWHWMSLDNFLRLSKRK